VADVLGECEAQLKGNAAVKDFARIPQGNRAVGRSRRLLGVAVAALLLPVLALGVTEITGVTHWLQKKGDGESARGKRPEEKGLPPDFTNTLGMTFKLIPAGTFTMGSPREEIDRCLKEFGGNDWAAERLPAEGPAHEVEITQPFYMGTMEVTVGQFRRFVKDKEYDVGDPVWQQPGINQDDKLPVVCVSWNNAVDFCNWLSEKEGKKYRLPTEAEWEYCCRAGKAPARYCFGDDEDQLENYAWYARNSGGGPLPMDKLKPNPGGRLHPVGKRAPNAWGLHDMHGNAWEWCQDNYDRMNNYYKNSVVKDPRGRAGDERVLRGGSCNWLPVFCRSAFRHFAFPAERYDDLGFRVLLVAP
jgi:formylglycine-generating enzyme required for sulfatase activity